ncbi:MAG: lysine--tRNA ligase [bacterium]|nr:lysine--tRNA ligase [bacterium]
MREITEQEQVRRDKLKEIKNPYPERYEVNYSLKEASKLEDGTTDVKVAGRIVLMRKMGKLSFLTIQDIEGRIQACMKLDLLGEEKYQEFKHNFDLGDFIGINGEVFTTQTGEKTIRVHDFTFLGKALKPLPEKFHGLVDQETIYRNRYIDLITSEESRRKFLFRSAFIRELRNYLNSIGYIEIETPILNNKPSGATARPFVTHHNALDIDLYLRIAPETYLKRAVVGGFTKVFEIARCFRNEGMDSSHLQDFTMIEGYGAYLNYEDNMKLLKDMLQTIIYKMFGTLNVMVGDKEVDLSGDWEVVSFRDLILRYSDIDIDVYNTKEKLLDKIKEEKLEIDSETPLEDLGYGNLVDQLYKKVARCHIVKPIYLTKHPISLSPLARANDENPNITDRFQLVINGAEIINAYSELVDPIEQEKRLLEQAKLKEAGDAEAMPMDYDYIDAMSYGMPPISGWGMGIDRIVQLLTNSENIKDCVMFPLMKPLNENKTTENE